MANPDGRSHVISMLNGFTPAIPLFSCFNTRLGEKHFDLRCEMEQAGVFG